jgi:hypothetical protein
MNVGFFLALRTDMSHYLHAAALVREVQRHMPGVGVVQLSDRETSAVPGVSAVTRLDWSGPLLHQRLALYATCIGEWLLVDTDVSIQNAVVGVFDDPVFDVALCDRNWPHSAQGEALMHTMPFNTGVVFCRSSTFWADVLAQWLALPDGVRADWMSEQRAVYEVVRTGRYRVKILSGMAYNYPPKTEDDAPVLAALLHYKGPRKAWRSARAYHLLGTP